ncbi:GDP-fucose transporter 1 [Eupeodes corollae]|uniref:GDP-fucose transporter 1 n=1 Tax=Eupeodes corollae TaxID=290404 RepID=UPI002490ABCC|nr:GDP-fucose transporter 1 [Eupeodes corollae]
MYKPLGEHNRLAFKYFQIFMVVALYWIVSILTVFVNKALLSSKDIDLDAPLFVTWFQCVVSTIICFAMSRLALIFPNTIRFPEGTPLEIDTFRRMLPLSFVFTSMIATNNMCLKYVGVAFYYVGRSLTTVFNVILSYIVLKQKTSFKSILCCAAIVLGFFLGVDQESLTDNFSWLGTFYGVVASLSVSMFSIYTKKALPLVNQEIWLLSYYNNFYSSILFLPLIIINGELNAIITYAHLFSGWFISVMIVGGIFGFAIGYVTSLQIKVTSPLTHNISGTAKACTQTIIATQWFNETKSFLWWISNGIVLLGSASYARVKQVEMEQQHNRSSISQKI